MLNNSIDCSAAHLESSKEVQEVKLVVVDEVESLPVINSDDAGIIYFTFPDAEFFNKSPDDAMDGLLRSC